MNVPYKYEGRESIELYWQWKFHTWLVMLNKSKREHKDAVCVQNCAYVSDKTSIRGEGGTHIGRW